MKANYLRQMAMALVVTMCAGVTSCGEDETTEDIDAALEAMDYTELAQTFAFALNEDSTMQPLDLHQFTQADFDKYIQGKGWTYKHRYAITAEGKLEEPEQLYGGLLPPVYYIPSDTTFVFLYEIDGLTPFYAKGTYNYDETNHTISVRTEREESQLTILYYNRQQDILFLYTTERGLKKSGPYVNNQLEVYTPIQGKTLKDECRRHGLEI